MDINQYKVEEMSNKVIGSKPVKIEENTMPQSLAGQISVKDMGTRVSAQTASDGPKPTTKHGTGTVGKANGTFSYSGSMESVSYRPTNEESAHIFELIMVQIHRFLPDASHDVIISAADSVLAILKEEESNMKIRHEINSLLDIEISDIDLNGLINLAKQIYDYDTQDAGNEDEEPEEQVAVVFDGSEGEDEVPVADVEDEDAENNDLGPTGGSLEHNNVDTIKNEEIITGNKETSEITTLSSHEIDEFYLQRIIKKTVDNEDPSFIQDLTKKFMSLLSNKSLNTRELENELMDLLDYDHFELIKHTINNRWKIVFKVRYLQCETGNQKDDLFEEMSELKLNDLLIELKGIVSNNNNAGAKKRRASFANEQDNKKQKQDVSSEREPQIIDLNALAFDQGSRLMTTSKVKLPQGSYQQNKKLYDIISVPAPNAPPMDESKEKLVSISELPEWARCAFSSSEVKNLNRIQSRIFPRAFGSDENLLLCAPTGAGKTNVAMLAILRAMNNHRDSNTEKINLRDFKIVYIAPLKALVQEQMREFQRRLTTNFSMVVNELTGDSSLSKSQIKETQVLITTPEKWDIITRKTDSSYVDLVKLIIIDEIHLLHDERGPVLESIVSRSIRQTEAYPDSLRLIGLSATLPNYLDVAKFLRVSVKTGLYFFDSSFRPCPLEQKFIGIKEKKAIKKVAAMNEACYEMLLKCVNENQQLIIFVHSRKETYKTVKWLSEKLSQEEQEHLLVKFGSGSFEILKQESEAMENKSLKDAVTRGFGIHHAGLNKQERSVVEDLFAQGHLQVLVSTATLAWGVNLPAHTVIIKGTETYSPEKGFWTQLSPQDILQMLGRAGRPRYDKSGEGVIITSQEELQYYLAILNEQLPIESQLISKLPDALNAEIVLGSITSRKDAIEWLGYTYLFVRMLSSPAIYHVGTEYENDTALYWKREDLAHTALTLLSNSHLVEYDKTKGSVKASELGKIASTFYISHETMHLFNNQLRPWLDEIGLLRIFCMSGEFKYIPVRQEEKFEVSKLIEKCPIPIKENQNDHLAKVNVLLQTYISRLSLEGFAFTADMVYITQSGGRLLRALHEIVLKKKWSSLTKITLTLCKMVERRMWLSSSPFRQFGKTVPKDIIRKSESSQLQWKSYFHLEPAELAEALNLRGSAEKAFDLLQQFPKVTLRARGRPITPQLIKIQLEVYPEWKWNHEYHGANEQFLLIVEDCDGNNILYTDRVVILKELIHKDVLIDFTVPVIFPMQPNYYISLLSEKWLHSEWRVPLALDVIKFPRKLPAFTDLLDLQSVPVSELKIPEFIETLNFNYFNKFQTQLFHSLYNSNDNLFIGMSKGNGKTTCAELAILNHWKENKGRILYLNPSEHVIQRLTRKWVKQYSKVSSSGKVVNQLTGELSDDIKILATSHLILATPDQFDFISRRWRQRKVVQAIELLIADDVHMVGDGSSGVSYEMLLARMRLMSTQVSTDLRIVGLSNPLLNARDFGEWLGCKKLDIFNFEPSQRYHKISEMKFHAATNFGEPTTKYLVNTAYEFIKEKGFDQGSLVFTSSRKHGQNFCLELVQKLTKNGVSLLDLPDEELQPYLTKIIDSSLRELLEYGIGFYHADMNPIDRVLVERLFTNNVIKILVASKESSMFCPHANNVIILGTQEYEGKEHRFVDYSIIEFLEMVGCAEEKMNEASVFVLTSMSKMNYYSKFVNEALPVESYLNFSLPDAFLHEISIGTLKKKQDCIDWLTFTYFYRRLQLNPSFYDVKDTSHLGISEFLSEIVEATLNELESVKLIEIEEENDEESDEEDVEEEISPLTGAMISSYYNILYDTMKEFGRLNNKTRMKGILEIVSSASELGILPIRQGEDEVLLRIYRQVPIKAVDEDLGSLSFKCFVLLQAHFSRIPLSAPLLTDQKFIIKKVLKILNACIDYLASEGYLNALHAMDLSQMIVQATWNNDTPLRQVPFFDKQILANCAAANVETVYDIMSLEDDERDKILTLDNDHQLEKVAEFVNQYPNVDLSYTFNSSQSILADQSVEIVINLDRDEDLDPDIVVAPHYPIAKTESWWIVIGDSATRQLYAIKKARVTKQSQNFNLTFSIPNPGHHKLSIWSVCDSYLDADKEVSLEIDVLNNPSSPT